MTLGLGAGFDEVREYNEEEEEEEETTMLTSSFPSSGVITRSM